MLITAGAKFQTTNNTGTSLIDTSFDHGIANLYQHCPYNMNKLAMTEIFLVLEKQKFIYTSTSTLVG